MKYIKLTNSDELVQVSDEDYDYLNQWNWQIDNKNKVQRSEYRNGIQTTIYMSRVVAERMEIDLSNEIDHKDRNRLNNQRENLRSATGSQNCANVGLRKDSSTGYKGVSFNKQTQKYQTRIEINGKRISLGYYFYAENAAQVYDRAAIELFGEFAYTNFPREFYK